MTDPITLPDFVEDAETKLPGIAEEYSVLQGLARPLLAHRKSDDFEHTVMLQSGIAWQHYLAILLLLAHGFGVQGLVLCRTLFEVVVGTLYLMKNPSLLSDFLDHGKLQFYDQGLATGLSQHDVAKFAKECKEIKARHALKAHQKGKRRLPWHGGDSIRSVASPVGLADIYDLLYPYASSATHADATRTLSHGPQGWKRSLESFLDEGESPIVRRSSFGLTGHLLLLVNQDLKMGNNKEANALLALIAERTKAAAMAN